MIFAREQVLGNVVAETQKWGGLTKVVEYYQMTLRDGTIVIIGRPHICSNWFIIVITPQGECVKDEQLCDANCKELKARVGG